MELRQLEYLVAVVEEASFTRAAQRVHVSQSGVSAQVRQLEKELGQQLLDRSGRTVRVTEAGAAVLPYARAALAAVVGSRQAVDELEGLVRGRVRVGMVTACTITVLFDQLADFRARHPGVEIALGEDTSDHLIEGVRSGRLDLALVAWSGELPAELGCHVLADERIVAGVPHGDPLARRRAIGFRALHEQPIVSMLRGTGVRTAFDSACAATGLWSRVAIEASAPDAVAGLAARGLGVAVLTESMLDAHSADLHALAIVEPELRASLGLIWRTDSPANPATRVLVEHARSRFAAALAE